MQVMNIRISCLLALTAALGMPLTMNGRTLTQHAAVDTIIANNMRLQSLRTRQQADFMQSISEATSLEGPEIEGEYLWGPESANKWNVGVTQKFDWPGSYSRRAKAVRQQAKAWEYLYAAECLSVRRQAKEYLAQLVYARQQIGLLEGVLGNLQKLSEYIKEGYEGGQMTILDVKKINLELYNTRAELANVRQDESNALAALAALNNNMPVSVDASAYGAEPLLDLDTYLMYARDCNPEVNSLTQQSAADRLQAEALRSSALPQLSVGYRHAYEEETHFNGLSVGISLPFWSRKKAVKAAALSAQATNFQAIAAASEAQASIAAEYENATKRSQQLASLDAVTLDENYPSLLQMAYKGGQINVLTYMQELNYYLTARKERLAAEYSLRLSLIALNRYNPAE